MEVVINISAALAPRGEAAVLPLTVVYRESEEDMTGIQAQGQLQAELDRQLDAPIQNGQATAGASSTANAKDPLRPRRKKAKRACAACQRAHLTCGMY